MRAHEKSAVFSILVRQIEAQEAKTAAEKEKVELEARIAQAQATMNNIRPALSVFGFDPSAPKLWDNVREALGEEMYYRAFRVARGDLELRSEPGTEENNEPANIQNESDEDEGIRGSGEREVPDVATANIKEIVVDRLRQAGDRGARVSEIKAFVIAQGIEMHEKTVGMTLYRLSKDRLARREGRIWFYVRPGELDERIIVTEGTLDPSPSKVT